MDNLSKGKIKTIVICGPTASGKTALGIELAKVFNAEIISADSRQVYKLLDIGTAKPDKTELEAVKHHFIDFLDVDEEYNAGKFGNDAFKKLEELSQKKKLSIVVGGSGLYIKALCEGIFSEETSKENMDIRLKLQDELARCGIDKLYSELARVDEVSYNRYTDKNPRRILRALEYYRITGKAFSQAHQEFAVSRNVEPLYFLIDYPREILYERINQRVIKMWENGLVEETENILKQGYSKELNSLNTVGYKETIKFLEKTYSKEETISEIQKNTRRYAKRQLTWCRKIENVHYLPADRDFNEVIKEAITISSDFLNK